MSERPFMQLYVSDFIGDTLQLSTEQIGAYMLLLMAMWNADGSLPDDDAKLARVVRMSVKKWRAVNEDVMAFFERKDGHISHNRLTNELQKVDRKSQSRASAGAKGGAAKALKNNNVDLANATAKGVAKPYHSPETITRDSSLRSESREAPRKRFQDPAAILQAETDPLTARRYADHMRQRGPRLTEQSTQAVVKLLREVRELGGKPSEALELAMSKGWGIFEIEWLRNAGMKLGGGAKETTDAVWQQRLDYWKQGQGWPHAWGPEPGTDGCKLPDHFNTQLKENAA